MHFQFFELVERKPCVELWPFGFFLFGLGVRTSLRASVGMQRRTDSLVAQNVRQSCSRRMRWRFALLEMFATGIVALVGGSFETLWAVQILVRETVDQFLHVRPVGFNDESHVSRTTQLPRQLLISVSEP